MGEKLKDAESKQNKKNNNSNKNGDGGKKEEITVVLKIDMYCEGCAAKIIKCVRGFEGVETVNAEVDANKLTVTGKVDPSKLRDNLAKKTKKKVDLISPQPKKENKDNKDAGNDTKGDNKRSDDSEKKKSEDKKSKEPPVTTAVLKVAFHCQGCINRIRKVVSRTKGIHDMSMDKEKETVTVKGTMDVKALAESLSEKLRKKVEVVPPKKDKEGEGGVQKEGGNGGNGKKKKGGGNGGGDGAGQQMEGNKMEFEATAVPFEVVYAYNNVYGPPGYMEHLHASQMFSDENPNACSIM